MNRYCEEQEEAADYYSSSSDDEDILIDYAKAVSSFECCPKWCLQNLPRSFITEEIQNICNAMYNMSKLERKKFLRSKIASSIVETTQKGYVKCQFYIGEPIVGFNNRVKSGNRGGGVISKVPICKKAFMKCFNIKNTTFNNLIKAIKTNNHSFDRLMSDKTKLSQVEVESAKAIAEFHNISLDQSHIAALKLTWSPAQLFAYGWMQTHFVLIGDQEPNSNEIHLDPMPIKDIYQDYVCECMATYNIASLEALTNLLRYEQFCELWKACFPHVKIRQYKAVTGKCKACAMFSQARREQVSMRARAYVTSLFALHKITYTGERIAYASRVNIAMLYPDKYLSINSDGMAQHHNVLPYLGNLASFGNTTLPQHLQGILGHGRFMMICRTFHTIHNSANAQIHSFLLYLQEIIQSEGKLPDTVFYQVDGGSENVAKIVVVLCELIICKGLCKSIIISRLLVGHTHCDNDAVYGKIWVTIRDKHLSTHEDYAKVLKTVMGENSKVEDVYILPDYEKYLEPCCDKKFGNYCKQLKTQHQIIFEHVTPNDQFPHGCKITYRAYSQDKVIEMVEERNTEVPGINIVPVQVSPVPTYPFPVMDEDGNIISEAGMHVMIKLPQFPLELMDVAPVEFPAGSRRQFDDVFAKIANHYKSCAPQVIQKWKEWEQTLIPKTDSAVEYKDSHPHQFKIPLWNQLFKPKIAEESTSINNSTQSQSVRDQIATALSAPAVDIDRMQRLIPNDCVTYSSKPSLPAEFLAKPRLTEEEFEKLKSLKASKASLSRKRRSMLPHQIVADGGSNRINNNKRQNNTVITSESTASRDHMNEGENVGLQNLQQQQQHHNSSENINIEEQDYSSSVQPQVSLQQQPEEGSGHQQYSDIIVAEPAPTTATIEKVCVGLSQDVIEKFCRQLRSHIAETLNRLSEMPRRFLPKKHFFVIKQAINDDTWLFCRIYKPIAGNLYQLEEILLSSSLANSNKQQVSYPVVSLDSTLLGSTWFLYQLVSNNRK